MVSWGTGAARRQRTAYRILKELDYLATWRTLGTPVVVGAVRTGLVVQRDIDVITYVDVPDVAAGFERIASLAVMPGVHVVFFENKLHQSLTGLYWEIGYDDGEEAWSIENTVFASDCPHASYPEETTEAIAQALDDDKRRCILAIKEEKLRRFGARHEQDRGEASIDIYRAVFDGRATSYDQCVEWIREHRRKGMYRWVPGAAGQDDRQTDSSRYMDKTVP